MLEPAAKASVTNGQGTRGASPISSLLDFTFCQLWGKVLSNPPSKG